MIKVLKQRVCGMVGLVLVVSLTGCASSMPMGTLFTELKLPVAATSNTAPAKMKVGVATCQSILGLVATGDASIDAAMKNGGITKIHHIDWDVRNILGLIGDYKITVYGE